MFNQISASSACKPNPETLQCMMDVCSVSNPLPSAADTRLRTRSIYATPASARSRVRLTFSRAPALRS